MPSITGTLPAKLRAARKAAGLSQVALAARLGTSQAAIARAEKGGATPSLDWLFRFAIAVACDPHSLDDRLMWIPTIPDHVDLEVE